MLFPSKMRTSSSLDAAEQKQLLHVLNTVARQQSIVTCCAYRSFSKAGLSLLRLKIAFFARSTLRFRPLQMPAKSS